MKKLFIIPIFIITLLVMLLLGHHNAAPVTVHWLIIQAQWPLAAIMAMMLFIGFSFGLICALLIGAKKNKQQKAKQQTPPEPLNQSTVDG